MGDLYSATIGLGGAILLFTVFFCYFCRGCPLYANRQRRRRQVITFITLPKPPDQQGAQGTSGNTPGGLAHSSQQQQSYIYNYDSQLQTYQVATISGGFSQPQPPAHPDPAPVYWYPPAIPSTPPPSYSELVAATKAAEASRGGDHPSYPPASAAGGSNDMPSNSQGQSNLGFVSNELHPVASALQAASLPSSSSPPIQAQSQDPPPPYSASAIISESLPPQPPK